LKFNSNLYKFGIRPKTASTVINLKKEIASFRRKVREQFTMNGGGAGPFQTVNPVPGYTAGDLPSRVFCSFLQPWQILQRPKTLSTVAHFDYEMNVSDDMSQASEIPFSVRNGKSETENPSRCILACLVFYAQFPY
jgi:hypothetical protein